MIIKNATLEDVYIAIQNIKKECTDVDFNTLKITVYFENNDAFITIEKTEPEQS